MIKLNLKFLHKTLIIFLQFNIFILSQNLYIFNLSSEIFPALELSIIFYISTYRKISYWHLLIIGLFLDQLYSTPLGVNSLILIIASLILKYICKLCVIKKYSTNIIIFCGYAFFLITARYIFITILSINYIEGNAIFFYLITTIFSYPIMYIILENSFKILANNAE